ncbi:hypothetical protein TPA0909_47760 [Streptomyces albus]|nr:hypothetical protein TPA0909_47760 [Streptomyces albus]
MDTPPKEATGTRGVGGWDGTSSYGVSYGVASNKLTHQGRKLEPGVPAHTGYGALAPPVAYGPREGRRDVAHPPGDTIRQEPGRPAQPAHPPHPSRTPPAHPADDQRERPRSAPAQSPVLREGAAPEQPNARRTGTPTARGHAG